MRDINAVISELKVRYAGEKDNIVNRLPLEQLTEAVKLVNEAIEHACSVEDYFLIWCEIAEQRRILVALGFTEFAKRSDQEILMTSESAAYLFDDALKPITEALKK